MVNSTNFKTINKPSVRVAQEEIQVNSKCHQYQTVQGDQVVEDKE